MRRSKITIPGLALLAVVLGAAAVSAQTPDWSQARPLTIELSSFKFTPAAPTLEHGAAYRLHLVNTSSGGHDFVAKEFFADSMIAPEDRAKIKGGSVDLDGGESVDIRLIPGKPGTYKLHCSHFMHSSFGMTGQVIVQ